MKKNRGADYLRGREMRMALEERSKQREIRSYLDVKTGVMVKVLAGPEDKPYTQGVPCGWSY